MSVGVAKRGHGASATPPGIHAIGEESRVAGLALAGAVVHAGDEPAAIRGAWDGLPESAAIVLLTPAAAAVLGERLAARPAALVCVLPETAA